MEIKITEELLHKYVSDSCTDAERRAVDRWYEAFESVPPLFIDETTDEARFWKSDVKKAIHVMVAGTKKSNEKDLQEIGVIHSWFLKATNT